MTKLATSNITAEFSDDFKPRLILKLKEGVSFSGTLPIRIYPANPDRVEATVGTITTIGNRQTEITAEAIKFDGASEAQTRFPEPQGGTYVKSGRVFRLDGSEVSPSFIYDSTIDKIIAIDNSTGKPVKIVGVCIASYTVRYTLVDYLPQSSFSITQGSLVETGYVYAFKGNTVEVLDIDIEFAKSKDVMTAYMVYSLGITDNQSIPISRWEYPKGWDSDNSFPFFPGQEPNPDHAVVEERPHLIGYSNLFGSVYTENFHVNIGKPYIGHSNYTPQYLFRQMNPTEDFKDAFNRINFDSVFTSLQPKFSNLIKE